MSDPDLLLRAEEAYLTSFPGARYPEDRRNRGPYVGGLDATLDVIDTEAAKLLQRSDGRSWVEGAPKKGAGLGHGAP